MKVAESLSTVNDLLVEQFLAITNDSLAGEELDVALNRAKVAVNIADSIIEVNKTAIMAVKVQNEYGVTNGMLAIENARDRREDV